MIATIVTAPSMTDATIAAFGSDANAMDPNTVPAAVLDAGARVALQTRAGTSRSRGHDRHRRTRVRHRTIASTASARAPVPPDSVPFMGPGARERIAGDGDVDPGGDGGQQRPHDARVRWTTTDTRRRRGSGNVPRSTPNGRWITLACGRRYFQTTVTVLEVDPANVAVAENFTLK